METLIFRINISGMTSNSGGDIAAQPISMHMTSGDLIPGSTHILTPLQPHTILLKDGETIATMYPIPSVASLFPRDLLQFLLDEFNMEIEKGDSFPYYETLSMEEFKDVWFHKDSHICIMVLGEIPELDYSVENEYSDLENNYGTNIDTMRKTAQYRMRKELRNLNLNIQWEKQCLGIFELQPAYPGRSSHVVTGTFLVNAGIRGKGIGRTLVEEFIEWSKRLGYTSSYFPLIYGSNVGIRRILEGLNFRRIGVLPESGILKGFDVPVDSFIYGKEFTHITKSMDLLRDPQKNNEIAKYERLRYYLETGKYPLHCDRNEKARLRVSAKTHSLLNGKLMTNGKEVIYDPEKQRQIALETHLVEHQGINKVTTKIVENYHWKGIKHTVSEVIAQCHKCKMRYQDGTGVIVTPSTTVKQAHMLPSRSINITKDMRHTKKFSSTATPTANNSKSNNKRIDSDDSNGPLSQMAEVVVGSLQREHQKQQQGTIGGQRKAYASALEDGLRHKNSEAGATDLNSFERFVAAGERTHRQKKQKLSTSIGTNANSDISSIIAGTHQSIMNDAMLNLEDNVMAALEMVQKDQQGNDIKNPTTTTINNNAERFLFGFDDDYQEEEDEDYEDQGEEDEEEDDEDEEDEDEEDDEEDDHNNDNNDIQGYSERIANAYNEMYNPQ